MSDDLVYIDDSVPPKFDAIPYREDDPTSLTCAICSSEHRERIEAIVMSGLSFARAIEAIQDRYGIELSKKQISNHLRKHMDEQRALQYMRIADMHGGDVPDDSSIASPDTLIMLLLGDAFAKIANGDIPIRSMRDVEAVMRMHQSSERLKQEREMFEKKIASDKEAATDAADAMRQLGYIMIALRETIPPHLLEQAVLRAWSLGMDQDYKDISEVPIYRVLSEGTDGDDTA